MNARTSQGAAAVGRRSCPHCHSVLELESVSGPRFGEQVCGMAEIVIVPSLIALGVACLGFLWLGNSATPDTEPVVAASVVRFALGLAIAITAVAGVVSSVIVYARKPVTRCAQCGAIAA